MKNRSPVRRGLKDTGVLRMIKERPSLTTVLFPRSSALLMEPEVIGLFYLGITRIDRMEAIALNQSFIFL